MDSSAARCAGIKVRQFDNWIDVLISVYPTGRNKSTGAEITLPTNRCFLNCKPGTGRTHEACSVKGVEFLIPVDVDVPIISPRLRRDVRWKTPSALGKY